MRYDFDEIFETGKDGKMNCKIDPELIKNDSDYEFTFHKILREISNENKKILDDWCKAYLAKQYQLGENIHPGNFTLEQRQVNDPNQVGWDYKLVPNDQNLGLGQRVSWQTIETAPRDGTQILLLDRNYSREVLLGKWWDKSQTNEEGFYSDDYKLDPTHWIKIPDMPPKRHFCSSGPLNLDVCQEREGKFFLTSSVVSVPPKEIEVTYCPFCGEKSDG